MTLVHFFATAFALFVTMHSGVFAQDQSAESPGKDTSDARAEFLQLAKAFDEHFRQNVVMRPLGDMAPEEIEKLRKENAAKRESKDVEFGLAEVELEALLLFEESHRGTHLGLMSLRKIILHFSRFAPRPGDANPAKSRALKRLVHYASWPVLSETLMHLTRASFDREVEGAIRAIINAPDVSKYVLPAAQLALSKWMLQFESFAVRRPIIEKQIAKLEKNGNPQAMPQLTMLHAGLAAAPDKATFARWEKEATQTLKSLQNSAKDVRVPAVKTFAKRNIVRVDQKATKEPPTIAELATRQLQQRAEMLKRIAETLGATANDVAK